MENQTNTGLIDRIHNTYDTLPSSERRIADILLDYPGDLLAFQSSELATRAGSSNAAFSRLIKRLGYKNYRDAQKYVRDAQMVGIPLYRVTSTSSTVSGDWTKDHLEADIQSLERTYAQLNSEAFEGCVAAAVKARRIWTIGFRNGFFFADYLKRQLTQYRPHVVQLPSTGQSVMEELGNATKDDLVIAIGVRRRPPQLQVYLDVLDRMTVPVAYITDHQSAKSTQSAKWVFRCHTRGLDQLDTYAGLVSLLGMFSTRFATAAGKPGRVYNEAVERRVGEANETDPGTRVAVVTKPNEST